MSPRPDPVTSDWQVARVMCGDPQESELCWVSGEIASILGITVFQITARLKGMQGRFLVERVQEFWRLTEVGYQLGTGPEPPKKEKVPLGERVYRTPTGGYYTPGMGAAALPDDSRVPHRSPEDAHGWRIRVVGIGPIDRDTGLHRAHIDVYIDPEGTEWVRCTPTEPAELICGETRYTVGLTPVRLRRRTGSTSVERTGQRQEKQATEIAERKRVKRKLYA